MSNSLCLPLQVGLGHDVNLVVDFHNQGDVPRTVQANLSGSIVFYTGVIANHFKDQPFSATVPANQSERRQC